MQQNREAFKWLGASAVSLGIGAAVTSGVGVAYADTPDADSSSSVNDHTANPSSPSAKKPTTGRSSRTTTSRVTGLTQPDRTETAESPVLPAAATADVAHATNASGPESTDVGNGKLFAIGADGPSRSAALSQPPGDSTAFKPVQVDSAAPFKNKSTSIAEINQPVTQGNPASPVEVSSIAEPASTLPVSGPSHAMAAPALATVSNWSPSPLAPIAKIFVGLLLSLGGMNTTNPNPTNGFQQFLYSLAKGINDTFAPAPPPGTPSVGTPNPVTGIVTGSSGFPGGGGLTFTTTEPDLGVVSVNSDGTYIYTPTQAARQSATASTTDSFTVTVHSGISTDSLVVTVPVDAGTPQRSPYNPPMPSPNNTGVVTGSAAVLFTDPAGRTLTYSTPGTSTGGGSVEIDATTGIYTYTSTSTQRREATPETVDTFTVTANNGVHSGSVVVAVPVAMYVSPVPGTPIVNAPSVSTGKVNGSAVFTDPTGQALTYSAPTSTTGGGSVTINPNTGAFTYTPTTVQRLKAAFGTTDTFIVTADNGVGTATETVTVQILPTTATVNSTIGGFAEGGNLGLATNPNGGYLYVTDTAGPIYIVDAQTNTVVGTITAGVGPRFAAVSPNGNHLYVTNFEDSTVSVIDTSTNTVTATIEVSDLSSNSSPLAISADGAQLYVVNENGTVSVINTATNTVTGSIPFSNSYWPGAVAATPEGLLYITNYTYGVTAVTVIDTATGNINPSISVGTTPYDNPYGVAASPDGHTLYATVPNSKNIVVIDTATKAVTTTINSGRALSLATSPDGTVLYAVKYDAAQVAVIDTATNTVITTISLSDKMPTNIAISPDGNHIYVTTISTATGLHTVSVISIAS